MTDEFNLLGELEQTTVNGPGNRYMIHLQGCPLKCPGCFNPESWNFKEKNIVNIYSLADKILDFSPEGLSISGGEPMMQAPTLLKFLQYLHKKSQPPFKKGILMYSGFYESELEEIPEYKEILSLVSVIISGRYIQEQRIYDSMLSSSNQKFIFGGQQSLILLSELQQQNFEIILNDGKIQMTGFPPLNKDILSELKHFGVNLKV
jgi:anaerobic ribonucleoside-triphosphate reductase activating protein